MAQTLSAQEVFELHKAAVTRDFVAKPRLGKCHTRIRRNIIETKFSTAPQITEQLPVSMVPWSFLIMSRYVRNYQLQLFLSGYWVAALFSFPSFLKSSTWRCPTVPFVQVKFSKSRARKPSFKYVTKKRNRFLKKTRIFTERTRALAVSYMWNDLGFRRYLRYRCKADARHLHGRHAPDPCIWRYVGSCL